MTIFPFQVGEVAGLYNRILKVKSIVTEPEGAEPRDVVTISADAKRQKILDEAKHAVLDRIRRTG